VTPHWTHRSCTSGVALINRSNMFQNVCVFRKHGVSSTIVKSNILLDKLNIAVYRRDSRGERIWPSLQLR
jgi:hypothetical protein